MTTSHNLVMWNVSLESKLRCPVRITTLNGCFQQSHLLLNPNTAALGHLPCQPLDSPPCSVGHWSLTISVTLSPLVYTQINVIGSLAAEARHSKSCNLGCSSVVEHVIQH